MTSKSAQTLSSNANVHIIEGNFDQAKDISHQVPNPWGLSSMTTPMNAKTEERQGEAMTAADMKAGVKYIVFTIRGSWRNKQQATEYDATWRFLRPVAFMENMSDDFVGKGFVNMWRLSGLDRPLQLISSKNIGKVAADAFLRTNRPEHRNQGVSLVGDSLSSYEAAKVFPEELGMELRRSYDFVGRVLRWVLHEPLGIMFDWFTTEGFGADIEANREIFPFMMDFRTCIK